MITKYFIKCNILEKNYSKTWIFWCPFIHTVNQYKKYKPLSGPLNDVLTRSSGFYIDTENVVTCSSIDSALDLLAGPLIKTLTGNSY